MLLSRKLRALMQFVAVEAPAGAVTTRQLGEAADFGNFIVGGASAREARQVIPHCLIETQPECCGLL